MVSAPPNSPATLRRRVDETLLAFMEAERVMQPAAAPLWDELVALIEAGGKRLRPIFCFWGHIAAGGDDGPAIMRAGAALELLHTFAIVHDDLVDRSPSRRGRPASFRALAAGDATRRRDPERFGESAAILAGDLALVLADRLLASSGFPSDALGRATERYDRMRISAITGEYLDIEAAYRGASDEAGARRIAVLKSGGYTVADPLAIGAALAGDDPRIHEALAAYGRPLGEAFQIRDDVLGVFGDPARTGKDRDSDLREGKQTVLVAKARAAATPPDRAFLDERLGAADLSPTDADRLRDVIRRTGALDATLALVEELATGAKSALADPIFATPARDALAELADLVVRRDA